MTAAAKEDDLLMPQKLTMAKEDTGTDFLTPQKLTTTNERTRERRKDRNGSLIIQYF